MLRILAAALLALTGLAGLAGCSRIHVPSSHNAPLFERAGETRIQASAGTHGLDFQGAHALTDRFAVIGGGSFSVGGQRINSHQYVEAAGGIYSARMGHLANRGVFRAEAFGGAGFGRAAGQTTLRLGEDELEERLAATYWKPFVQADLGVARSAFDAGLSTRLAYTRHAFRDPPDLEVPADVDGDVWTVEPAFFVRYALRDFHLQAQIGAAVPIDESDVDVQPVLFGVGVQYRLFLGIPDVAPE